MLVNRLSVLTMLSNFSFFFSRNFPQSSFSFAIKNVCSTVSKSSYPIIYCCFSRTDISINFKQLGDDFLTAGVTQDRSLNDASKFHFIMRHFSKFETPSLAKINLPRLSKNKFHRLKQKSFLLTIQITACNALE